jgi:hypothetical protein
LSQSLLGTKTVCFFLPSPQNIYDSRTNMAGLLTSQPKRLAPHSVPSKDLTSRFVCFGRLNNQQETHSEKNSHNHHKVGSGIM